MKKRMLFLALTLAAMVAVFALTASAAERCGDYFYTVSNGKATITDVDSYIAGDITIPSTLDGYPVTSIGWNAFSGCSSLTSVTIPSSVTGIDDAAFYNCSSLTSVTIPSSVMSIDAAAFQNCSSLTSVMISEGVKSIGNNAFQSCISLTSVTIPSSVTHIGSSAFYGCSSLTSVTIPSSVTNIGRSAFRSCSSLTSVTIPSSVTSIGDYAFYGCSSLTSVTIPSSVTSIGEYAFYGCSSLTSVTIPSSVTSIGEYAFYGCSSLTSITVDGENLYYSSEEGVLFNKAKTILIQYPVGNTRTNYTIPASVTSIGSSAFQSCSSLTSVMISEGVKSIGNNAFQSCISLTSVTIPSSVMSIGSSAFSGCSSLTSVTIPSSVTSIGNYAFCYCSSLTSVTIPSSVTSIGAYVFEYCRSLASVTISEGVKSIGEYVFYNCVNLTSVTIPSSVTSIGDSAFFYCHSLTSVTIPSSVTSIGDSAFTSTTIYGYSGSAAESYAANNSSSITFVALDGNAVAPAITTQPHGQFAGYNFVTYYAGDNATPMTVEAFAYADGTLSYAWYKADSAEGEGVKVGDTASCTPDVATVGTAYYYVVVTNTWTNVNNITTTASTKSNVITVTVNSIAPIIQFQTSGPVNCYPDSSTPSLHVSAPQGIMRTLSYAWYRADSADGEGVKVGDGQSHVPDTTTAGTYYYYAIVTCTRTNNAGVTATASTKSEVITVIVHARTVLTGSFTSYDPDAPAKIELIQNGMIVMNQYVCSSGISGGQATQNFTFTITTSGTYDLRIIKGGHLTATVTGITVDGTSNVTLDPITLLAGDVNGDGVINVADVALLRMADNYGKSADDCVLDFTAP